jgi:alpha-1,3-glucosyltransferase
LRCLIALHPYSGQSNAPSFGDYEAHRHAMSIMVNTPLRDWYTTSPKYWPLIHPPLYAYWSWLTGKVSSFVDPKWTALKLSKGFQSEDLKTFMRSTVFLTDLLVLFPGVFELANAINNFPKAHVLIALLAPPLLLVDHGHFQYNGVMLGLIAVSFAALLKRNYFKSVIFACLAVSFNKSAAFYFPAIGAALFGVGLSFSSSFQTFKFFAYLTLAALLIFVPLIAPFYDALFALFNRQFEVQNGLFEDLVGNFWCPLTFVSKFYENRTNLELFLLCSKVVAAAILPIMIPLIFIYKKQTAKAVPAQRFLLGVSAISLVFFLFSFHIHELQILVPLVPILFLIPHSAFFVYFFTIWSSFSLFPLLKRDGLSTPYYCLQAIWSLMYFSTFRKQFSNIPAGWKLLIVASIEIVLTQHVAEALWTPPVRFPDFFNSLNAITCAVAFLCSLIYLFIQFFLSSPVNK